MLAVHRFDPSACGFPAPAVSVLPRAEWKGITLAAHKGGTGMERRYARGRYALRDAYRLSGVGPDTALLVPSYHCRTMIDPAIALGAEVALYRLTPALEPDMTTLRQIVAGCARPVRALLATHFFGFPSQLGAVAALCKEHGIALIEDCSHVWMPGTVLHGMGTQGRYVVSSFYKFVPSDDGALLRANDGAPLPPDGRQRGLGDELRGVAHILQRTRRAALSPPKFDMLDDLVQEGDSNCGAHWVESAASHSGSYRPEDEGIGCLRSSLWLLRHTDPLQVAERRRHRYRQWVDAMRGLPGCRPPFPVLPEHCVPYMFAIHIDSPDRPFTQLKRMGVPVWRWDEMAVSNCSTAAAYRLGLLHLPCHQQLSDADMEWMTTAVASVLSAATEKVGA
jgi:hypothetical protein